MMKTEELESLRRFYEDHRRELYTYALSFTRCRDSAEDVIHQVFARLLQTRRHPRELRPYVYRCVRNSAIDHLRSGLREVSGDSIFELSDGGQSSNGVRRKREIEQLLESLSEDERETIVLKIFNALTFKEIATVRKVSINTAASWYRRGIEKMRVIAEEDKG